MSSANTKEFFVRCKNKTHIYDMNTETSQLKERDKEWKQKDINAFLESLFVDDNEKSTCGEAPIFDYSIKYDEPYITLDAIVETALEKYFNENKK